jgi:heat shock protein HslJ
MRLLPLAAITAAAVAACSQPDPTPDAQVPDSASISTVPAPAAAAPGDTALAGPEWRLVELNGRPAGTGAGGRPATLQFIEEGRVAGFGGCNRIAGPYAVTGDSLRLGPLVMTRMACSEGMELETAFAAALDSVESYRRDGSALELLRAADVIARLEAR